jgi:predicted lipoprotein with Yx(FWY)xxD motif
MAFLSRTVACTVLLGATLLAGCASSMGSASGAPAKAQDGVLVGGNGMTLYVFDKDAGGKSMCNGACATNWPPLKADASAGASGDWSTVARDDGSRQWAYKGKPVYFWNKDQKPGDRTGDGFNGVWHLARP